MLSCIKPELIKPRNVARVAVMVVLIVNNSCITDWPKRQRAYHTLSLQLNIYICTPPPKIKKNNNKKKKKEWRQMKENTWMRDRRGVSLDEYMG